MKLSRIVIGAMRFTGREETAATLREAIDAGFNYIDTSPAYCYQSESECSEAWVGDFLRDPAYRSRVLVSTKCTPGDGGMGLGKEFKQRAGFGVRTAAQLCKVFNQSLKRLKMERIDFYHLWTTHTHEQLAEAFKPGGWYEGVESCRDRFTNFGITTHAESKTIIEFLETGRFQTVTIPLNVINTTRLPVVDYCAKRGIEVIAMNPFAGGLLTKREDIKELALRYLLSLGEHVHPLIGFSTPDEVRYARQILDTMGKRKYTAAKILAQVDGLIDTTEPRCTACGYCQPCPQGINLGASLSYYNAYKYLGIKDAKVQFNNKQWEDGLRLDKCTGCMICRSRCPNALPLDKIIPQAKKTLYGKAGK